MNLEFTTIHYQPGLLEHRSAALTRATEAPMAQADSVPTPIPRPITDAESKASTKRRSSADRVDLIGALNAGEAKLLQFGREKGDDAEPEHLSANSTDDLNGRWYEAITGRMPVGWYIVAVCYATAVILLGWLPWNALLILLLLSNSKRLRFDTFDTMPSDRFGSLQ
jgi:hypothetical protein